MRLAAERQTFGPRLATFRGQARMKAGIGTVGFIAFMLACALCVPPAYAASTGMPRPPEELLKMRQAFAAAALAGDAEAAAKLSHFPLAVAAARGGRTLSRAEFLKRFKEDFMKHGDIVYCWQNHNLEMEYRNGMSNFRIWHLDCGNAIYDFAIFDGRWLYTGYRSGR
jgi:hypothetical protein